VPWQTDKGVLILVHVITDSPKSWLLVTKSLVLNQRQVLLFHYLLGFSLEASDKVLANLVEELHQRVGDKRVDIIAHSMGDLVAKRLSSCTTIAIHPKLSETLCGFTLIRGGLVSHETNLPTRFGNTYDFTYHVVYYAA
tara:strand:+ start:3285 stop:3701 length:417 start_codon:yes stop_codon:yes gene_type:complete